MAELVDALALGASGVTLVRVRVSLWAPTGNPNLFEFPGRFCNCFDYKKSLH